MDGVFNLTQFMNKEVRLTLLDGSEKEPIVGTVSGYVAAGTQQIGLVLNEPTSANRSIPCVYPWTSIAYIEVAALAKSAAA